MNGDLIFMFTIIPTTVIIVLGPLSNMHQDWKTNRTLNWACNALSMVLVVIGGFALMLRLCGYHMQPAKPVHYEKVENVYRIVPDK